jgi:hypothetical protein
MKPGNNESDEATWSARQFSFVGLSTSKGKKVTGKYHQGAGGDGESTRAISCSCRSLAGGTFGHALRRFLRRLEAGVSCGVNTGRKTDPDKEARRAKKDRRMARPIQGFLPFGFAQGQ